MKIFDAQMRSDICSNADLQNLHYFETECVITCAHAPRKFERAEDLLGYFEALLGEERARLIGCGLKPYVALGVLPSAVPRRSHFEVWRALPALLKRPEVVALGEVGAWADDARQWALFERQVKIARDLGSPRSGQKRRVAGLPMICTPPEGLRVNMTFKMMQRVEKLGMAPGRVMMNRLDDRLIEAVVREGFVAGVSVGTSNLKPRASARVLADLIQTLGSAEGIVLNSALRAGGADILGVPKTIVALQDLGVDAESIEKMVYGNAKALFLDNANRVTA
ncbi:TatD family hydrolase [Bradymonas sediminis]|uniref:Uncharacterized protein n=1 Tax=Bradymonas sediminis TaxID=1548548 RepID=A0A2Z4FJQ5_9DELT|nr:hypothetical protein [Bradymonas sediminis]AWV88946.1 hypothetical protein DN745_06160 [Bradymonas sediminis]TDP71955.1 putative metal-dependent TIM-barrel fold hydrolase [Bradymonas sediminis]